MRLKIAIPLLLMLGLPAAGQDVPPVSAPRLVQPTPPIAVPSPVPPGVTDAERRLFERAARYPSFAYAPRDPATERSRRGTTSVTVYRGPQEALTYRVPIAPRLRP